MKTFVAKKESVEPKWHVVDAEGQILGRLAAKVHGFDGQNQADVYSARGYRRLRNCRKCREDKG